MPAYKNPKKTHRYADEFKIKAVQLSHLRNVQVKEIAEALDIHPFMLSRWRKEYREGKLKVDQKKKATQTAKKKPKKSDNARIRELEKQVKWLQEENEILKKWQRFLAEQRQKDSNS